MSWHLYQGDALTVLKSLPEKSIHCCVTSPPYFGLRDYGLPPIAWPEVEYFPMPGLPPVRIPAWEGQLGLEPTPEMYVGHLVLVFREVRRVLRDDGTLWLNLGTTLISKSIEVMVLRDDLTEEERQYVLEELKAHAKQS